jgi:hypothetical protein
LWQLSRDFSHSFIKFPATVGLVERKDDMDDHNDFNAEAMMDDLFVAIRKHTKMCGSGVS